MSNIPLNRTKSFDEEIITYFQACRCSGLFTDVRLYGSDPEYFISVHGLVLHSVSPRIREIMSLVSQLDYVEEYIALIFPEATQDDLKTLVEGMYDPNRIVSVDSQGIQDLIQILQLEFVPAEGIKQELDDDVDFEETSVLPEQVVTKLEELEGRVSITVTPKRKKNLSKRKKKCDDESEETTSVKCPWCPNTYSKLSHPKHVRRFHSAEAQEAKLKARKARMAKLEKTFQCEYCEEEFANRKTRLHHTKKKHSDKIIKQDRGSRCAACQGRHEDGVCCICLWRFTDIYKCHKHVRKDHVCAKCDKKFPKKAEKEEHMNREHGETLKETCHYCGFKYNNLHIHIRYQHEGAERVPCQLCDRTFYAPSQLANHMIMFHSTPEEKAEFRRKYQAFCDLCGKVFYDKKNLKKHVQHVHLKIKAFKCNICQGDFVTKQSMQNHVKAVHHGVKAFKQE